MQLNAIKLAFSLNLKPTESLWSQAALLSLGIAIVMLVLKMRNVSNPADITFVHIYVDTERPITPFIKSQQQLSVLVKSCTSKSTQEY